MRAYFNITGEVCWCVQRRLCNAHCLCSRVTMGPQDMSMHNRCTDDQVDAGMYTVSPGILSQALGRSLACALMFTGSTCTCAAQNVPSASELFWHDAYALRSFPDGRIACPDCLRGVAADVLSAGKAAVLLRHSQASASRHARETSRCMHAALTTSI